MAWVNHVQHSWQDHSALSFGWSILIHLSSCIRMYITVFRLYITVFFLGLKKGNTLYLCYPQIRICWSALTGTYWASSSDCWRCSVKRFRRVSPVSVFHQRKTPAATADDNVNRISRQALKIRIGSTPVLSFISLHCLFGCGYCKVYILLCIL